MIRFFIIALLLLLLSFVVQEFVPVFEWAYFSRLLVVHTVFYTLAVAVPFPAMLLLAGLGGFVWDMRYHLPIHQGTEIAAAGITQTELPFGLTIIIFGLMGSIIQGVRPLFRRGRWEFPIIMIGLCTAGGLLIEYLVISFNRGSLDTPAELWLKLLMTALFSSLLSPFLLLLLSRAARWVQYRLRVEGFKRRYTYDGDTL